LNIQSAQAGPGSADLVEPGSTNVEVDVQLDGGPRANPSEVAIVANQSTAVRSTGLDSAEPLKGLHAHARTFPFSL